MEEGAYDVHLNKVKTLMNKLIISLIIKMLSSFNNSDFILYK